MPICRVNKTGVTPDQYEQLRSHLGIDDTPPPGGLIHIAAKGDDGTIRIVELWEAREHAEAWAAKVRAARQELGIEGAPPQITYLEVQRVVTAGARPIEGVGTQTTG